ncbi:MAG: hypothetical protein HC904_09585 [Blastochloris sp.]|nr:hypothetical protein [Blastochloris sp.]
MSLRLGLRDYVIKAEGDVEAMCAARDLGLSGYEPGPTREQLAEWPSVRLAELQEGRERSGLEVPNLSLNHHNWGGAGFGGCDFAGLGAGGNPTGF